jgi:PAS domain S-box-containing protein
MSDNGSRSVDGQPVLTTPLPPSWQKPGCRLNALVILSDSQLANRCVAVLKAAGFDVWVDLVREWTQLESALKSKKYGLIIGESELVSSPGNRVAEAIERSAVDIPFIQVTDHLDCDRAEPLSQPELADCVSAKELARLPLIAARVLEVKRWRDEAAWANGARRLAQERYQSLFHQDMAGVYRASLDGQILELNEAGARMLGYPRNEDARNHRLQEVASREEDVDYLLRRVLEKRTIGHFEMDLRRRDGQLISVLASASLVDHGPDWPPVIEGILLDITLWKRAEEAVRRDERRFRTMLEKSSDAISLVDSAGRVVYSSHAVSPIFGYNLDERVGKNVFE